VIDASVPRKSAIPSSSSRCIVNVPQMKRTLVAQPDVVVRAEVHHLAEAFQPDHRRLRALDVTQRFQHAPVTHLAQLAGQPLAQPLIQRGSSDPFRVKRHIAMSSR
jgi:hypothetical protein